MDTLQALIKTEYTLFQSRADFFLQLLSKKDSCPKRLAWLDSWTRPFMELERKTTDIEKAIEKEANNIFSKLSLSRENTTSDEIVVLKSILAQRLDNLIKFFERERSYWQLIGRNIFMTIDKDIKEYTNERNALKEGSSVTTAK